MNRTKLTAALKSNLDATRALAQFLNDSEPPILDYDTAMSIPVRCPQISRAIAAAWEDSSGACDYVSDALGEIEADYEIFTERGWNALLDE